MVVVDLDAEILTGAVSVPFSSWLDNKVCACLWSLVQVKNVYIIHTHSSRLLLSPLLSVKRPKEKQVVCDPCPEPSNQTGGRFCMRSWLRHSSDVWLRELSPNGHVCFHQTRTLASPRMSILLRGADRSGSRRAVTKQNCGSVSVDPSVKSPPEALTGVWQVTF